MTSKEGDLHHQLFLSYKSAHADLSAQQCQKNANEIWKKAKEKLKNKEKLLEHVNHVIRELKVKATKKKAIMLGYFTQVSLLLKYNTYFFYVCSPISPSFEGRFPNFLQCYILVNNQFITRTIYSMKSVHFW